MKVNCVLLLSILVLTGCVYDKCTKEGSSLPSIESGCHSDLVQVPNKFEVHSLKLPALIRGLGEGPPAYDFSFLQGPEQKASYEKKFRERLIKDYPPGSPEQELVHDLKQQGFVFDKENSFNVGYQGKKWNIYTYTEFVHISVGTWLIAWRSDPSGKIIELECEAIPGTT